MLMGAYFGSRAVGADPGLLGADEGLRGSAIVDKQGNLVPDTHFIFSTLPDSSLLAEGEACCSPDCTVDIEHAWELDLAVMQRFIICWMVKKAAWCVRCLIPPAETSCICIEMLLQGQHLHHTSRMVGKVSLIFHLLQG